MEGESRAIIFVVRHMMEEHEAWLEVEARAWHKTLECYKRVLKMLEMLILLITKSLSSWEM